MSHRQPWVECYLDPDCKVKLDPKKPYGPCEAGSSQIYDIYARNEGELSYEQYEILVKPFYQVPKEDGKGFTLQETRDLELLRTPRPHRLEPGAVAHIRVEWKPPLDNWYPLQFTVEIAGPFIIVAGE